MEKEEFNILFGQFIKHKRTQKKLTLKELGLRVGSEFQNIHRLEQGKINPSIHWISTLAEGFGTTLSQLMLDFETFVADKQKQHSR